MKGMVIYMNNKPIGVFDSGLGGLTMIKKLIELLPGEDLIYLGDTGRVPYGPRSRETIAKYAGQDAAFLAKHGIKAMVVACNTVCSVALDSLKSIYTIPIYEVVNAPAKVAAALTKNGKIGVIGTAATIRSGAYETVLKNINAKLNVYSIPCPLFVPLTEEGWTGAADDVSLSIASRYLDGLCKEDIDTLILGCTHYPLLRDIISKTMGPAVTLVDSGAETAKQVACDLKDKDLLNENKTGGTIKYYVTDTVQGFSSMASVFLESDVNGMVEQISLD